MDYNLLKIFGKVAELGSFTKAAKVLNQPKSRVSRAISRLEAELGVHLIRRTTRKTSLTNLGEEFYKKTTPLLNSIQNEIINVTNQQEEMSGLLRITAPQDIGDSLLPQIIAAFNSKYPNVEIQTLITNEILDLTKENIDISFRAGKMQDSSLIQKKLMTASFIAVCSKKYLAQFGQPKVTDLTNHKFLYFKGLEKNFFEKNVKIEPIVTSDSISMLLSLALNDVGITFIPEYICQKELLSGDLIRVLPDLKSQTGHIHILYHSSKNTPVKIKKFIEISTQYV